MHNKNILMRKTMVKTYTIIYIWVNISVLICTNDTSTCIENDYNFINNNLRILQTAASNLSGHSHKTVLYHKIL